MANWIDELDEETKEADRKNNERATKYDDELDQVTREYDEKVRRQSQKWDEGD